MKCTVCSQDNYISEGIQSLFSSFRKRVNFESVFFIDVMTVPTLSENDRVEITDADLLIFIVDSVSHCRILEDNVFLKNKKNIIVKYICRMAQPYEFQDLFRCGLDFYFGYPSMSEGFNDTELNMIAFMGSGKPVSECVVCRSMSIKMISDCKRKIMRKLNVSTDIKLYDVIMKCASVNQKLSSLCY